MQAVITCNTAHVLYDEIADIIGVKPVSLIKCVAAYVQIKKYSKVGLLATSATIKANVYSDISAELVCLDKTKQKEIEKLIRQVIANDKNIDTQALTNQIEELQSMGCEAVILGCTELSVITDKLEIRNTIDPLSIVVPHLFKDIMEEI